MRRKDATCMVEGSALRILIRLNRAASSFFKIDVRAKVYAPIAKIKFDR